MSAGGPVGVPNVMQISPTMTNDTPPMVDTRIEDGKLLYERRWFHRGQSVYVEGKDMPKFPANISAIGTEAVSIEIFIDVFDTNHLFVCLVTSV